MVLVIMLYKVILTFESFNKICKWDDATEEISGAVFQPNEHLQGLPLSDLEPLPLKPGFHMSGKSQTIGDFADFRPSRIFPTNENHKS